MQVLVGQFQHWFGDLSIIAVLSALRLELTVFCAFWIALACLDDFVVDLIYAALRLTGKVQTGRLTGDQQAVPLKGMAAVFIPAWREDVVIGATIRHLLGVWRQEDLRLYVGTYCNDPATIEAVMRAAGGDTRLRLVICDEAGPTTKGDCLNRLYRAMQEDEQRFAFRVRSVVLHDAEDLVHPDGLWLLDQTIDQAGFVQLPVRPEPQPGGLWIGGHYLDEFAEAHAKAMVVRDALDLGLPAAGVGCAFDRELLADIARQAAAHGLMTDGSGGPFPAGCLTEDYLLGMMAGRFGRRSRFLRVRDRKGQLVATRCYFPTSLPAAVRQKARWVHGIAFQGWERLGWSHRWSDNWMLARDRCGPFAAFTIAVSYGLVVLTSLGERAGGGRAHLGGTPVPAVLIWLCGAGLVWRALNRMIFTAREYGLAEGARAVLRIPLANIVAIMAARRALASYVAALRGRAVGWDKTSHTTHPAMILPGGPQR